jgi:NADP-dependent 3-hydroxy acid dehydrogenase YdfG
VSNIGINQSQLTTIYLGFSFEAIGQSIRHNLHGTKIQIPTIIPGRVNHEERLMIQKKLK